MSDEIETKSEPVKKGPKLQFLPDPQDIIGDFVDAFVSDEEADSYEKRIVKDFLSKSYERMFLKKATARWRTGAAGVRYTDCQRIDDPDDDYVLKKARQVAECKDQALLMAVLIGLSDGHIDRKKLRDMISQHTTRTKPDEGGRQITTLINMNIVDQVDGKNVIHKPELLGPVFEDVLKEWSIKWGLSEDQTEAQNPDGDEVPVKSRRKSRPADDGNAT
jgi:hypothetical protein